MDSIREMVSSNHHQGSEPRSTSEVLEPSRSSSGHYLAANEENIVEACESFVGIDSDSSSSDDKIITGTQDVDQSEVQKTRISLPSCCRLFSCVPSRRSRTRLYQVWPGNNVFFFRGRIVCGPDPRGLLLTSVSIVLSDWIFCTYIGDRSVIVVIFSNILTVIVNLILASTRDPGIIPRENNSSLEVGSSIGRTRSRRICVDGIEMKLKYCRVCRIFRPPRSCHCTICDNCVERFDHHCPWVSQCIGLRNYRYYMMFVLSAFVFFLYMFAFSWRRIRRKVSDTRSGVFGVAADVPETLALALFSFFAIWFLGGLTIFHAYLIAKNQTARENFKQRYAKSPNPYDKGILGNIKEALFTRLPPSKVNFRSVLEHSCDSAPRTSIEIAGVDEEDTILIHHEEESPLKFSEGGDSEIVELETK